MKKDTSGRQMIIHAPLLTREIMGIVLIALVLIFKQQLISLVHTILGKVVSQSNQV